MKKILFVFCCIIGVSQLHAQNIRVGVKGGGNTTWLMNDNVFGSSHINVMPTFGANVGLTGTYWFNHAMGVSLDIMYASVNQNYRPDDDDDIGALNIKEKLRYIDLPLLFKVGSDKGPYFEIGPKFSLLSNHREEFTFTNGILNGFGGSSSNKKDFNSFVFSIALGFGVDIKFGDNMGMNIGLRFAYNPGDAIKKQSENELMNQKDHSIITYYSSFDNYTGNNDEYKYKKTHIVTGGLLIGYFYQFGGKEK